MKIYYVQMNSPGALVSAGPVEGLRLRKVEPPDGRVNRRFYREVGGVWSWTERAAWSVRSWDEYLASAPIVTAVLEKHEREIGYTELLNEAGEIEIVNFGLLAPFIGKGLGSAALVEVVRLAWSLPEARRVWLHTCDHDHPNALNNYRRRGFELYHTEELPDRP